VLSNKMSPEPIQGLLRVATGAIEVIQLDLISESVSTERKVNNLK